MTIYSTKHVIIQIVFQSTVYGIIIVLRHTSPKEGNNGYIETIENVQQNG
jgi:hypothetical protein